MVEWWNIGGILFCFRIKIQYIINMIVYFVIVSFLRLVWGNPSCPTATVCNFKQHQVFATENNCTRCICSEGYYQHDALGGCKACRQCHYPYVAEKECTHKSNTECVQCKENYYYTKNGCKKCQHCEHGVLEACGKTHDAVCAMPVTTPTVHLEKPSINGKPTTGNQVNDGTGKDFKCNSIWYYLSIGQFVIILIIIFVFGVCWNQRRRLYMHTDMSSLATSLSSLMLTKPKCPEITALTEQERETLIRVLPGGYAESLGELLNPNIPNNWVQLGYAFQLTLNEVEINRGNATESTQNLLWHLGTRNITVEMLWKALKKIKRDDACGVLINFILNLRNDNESAIVCI